MGAAAGKGWPTLGLELLRLAWVCASWAAHMAPVVLVASGSLSSPTSPNSVEEDETFKGLRSKLFHNFRLRILVAVYEAVTARLYGRSFALRSDPRYRHWMASNRPAWQPLFSDADPSAPSAEIGSSQGGIVDTVSVSQSGASNVPGVPFSSPPVEEVSSLDPEEFACLDATALSLPSPVAELG